MGHYARVHNGVVTHVIVADQAFIDVYNDGEPGEWLQTSYNTSCGVHVLGGIPLRKNFAGIGFTYDRERDAFIPPKPFPSWVLNEQTCQWEAPVAYPQDGGKYWWDEAGAGWTPVDA